METLFNLESWWHIAGANQGATNRPINETIEAVQRAGAGRALDGTNKEQTSDAQPIKIAVSIAIEESVTARETPSFAASCTRDTTATSPVGR